MRRGDADERFGDGARRSHAKVKAGVRAGLQRRLRALRGNVTLVVHTGLAAGGAWYVAHDVVGHPQPFFAPIAAVIALGVSLGHRTRRIVELVAGVALGIGIGDLLIFAIGTGAWQIALVVMLALVVAMLIGSGGPLTTQAASSAVLVATITPPGNAVFSRLVDALIGGGVAFGVHALLLPLNPLRHVRRTTHAVLDVLVGGLATLADALADEDAEAAGEVLRRLRGSERALTAFREALHIGREASLVAPVRWHARGQLSGYVAAARHIDHAMRNARVLARRANAALVAGERIPAGLPEAIRTLADATRHLCRDLEHDADPTATRRTCQAAVSRAAIAFERSRRASVDRDPAADLSVGVVVAQVRSIAMDLLCATGLAPDDARRTVRRAAHRS